MNFENLTSEIQNKHFKPVYLLQGDEPYFIDQLLELFEEHALEEHEKDFNMQVFYGKDSTFDMVVNAAQRFPMMAERQLVIVREAQDMLEWRREEGRDYLQNYIEHAQPSTVLVFSYKYKRLAKNTKIVKAFDKEGVVFDSKKVYNDKLPDWIRSRSREMGIEMEPQVYLLLAEYLGADLGKVVHSLEKLKFTVGDERAITTEDVEKYIGISKDFNVFELQDAIATKNHLKAQQIIRYFSANPKDHALPMTVGFLFTYYTNLLHFRSLTDKSNNEVMQQMKVPWPAINSLRVGGANYSDKQLIRNISLLRGVERKIKGIEYLNASTEEIQEQLIFDLMNG